MGAFKKKWKYVISTKLGQYVNEMIDGSCCEKLSESLMIQFSYNQTKR